MTFGCGSITVPLPERSVGYYSAQYRVTVEPDLLVDDDGLALPGIDGSQWWFRTEVDRVPPRVLRLEPARGRSDVPTQVT